jgi:hypothetical protein
MRYVPILLTLIVANGNLVAGGKENAGAIRIQLAIPRTDSDEKDKDRLKALKDGLKERNVELVDLRIGTSPYASAIVQYHLDVPAKELLGLTEFLLNQGVRQLTLEPRLSPVSKAKLPPSIGSADFLMLVLIEKSERAFVRNRADKNSERPLVVGTIFKFENEDDKEVTAKVVKIEAREIVIAVGEMYYSFFIGAKLSDALKEPLSKERIKELKLPSP